MLGSQEQVALVSWLVLMTIVKMLLSHYPYPRNGSFPMSPGPFLDV